MVCSFAIYVHNGWRSIILNCYLNLTRAHIDADAVPEFTTIKHLPLSNCKSAVVTPFNSVYKLAFPDSL